MKLNLAFIFCAVWLLASCASSSDKRGSAAMATSPSSAPITISAQDAHIALMGRTRVNSDGSRSAGYPGVSYFLTATGTSLSMIASSNSGNGWVDVIVDEGEPRLLQLAQQPTTYELFNFAEAGEHRVRITHRSETWQAISTIHSFTLHGGNFLPAPALPARKILLLGDSVTCGEMIDRVPGEERNARWSNARESYGMLSAAALDAQVQLVCYGGRGLVRSWNGKTDELNLPDFYPLALADQSQPTTWDKSQFTPDLVISAIGTNDFSLGIPKQRTYVATYVKLVKQILADYPRAQVALMEGSILNEEKKRALIRYIAATVKQLNDPRVHQLIANHYPGDEQDAHPTKAQHREMAEDLTPQVRALMNW